MRLRGSVAAGVAASLVLGALVAPTLHGCGGDDGGSQPMPAAGDPAFGLAGNLLVAEEGSGPGASVLRMWVGFSRSAPQFARIRADEARLLAGEAVILGGDVVPSAHHPLGFYFDPTTTRIAANVSPYKLTTLAALRANPTHPKRVWSNDFSGPWVRVTVRQLVETPATCGDGFVQRAEECDPPGSPCQGPIEEGHTVPRVCTAECRCPPACGNGVVDGIDEQCDDGNEIDGDGCSHCLLDPVETTHDFAAAFREFAFTASSGFGFCPGGPNAPSEVVITRDPRDETLHLTASVFGDTSGCEFSFPGDECPGTIHLPARVLTAVESARVLDAFRAVVVIETPGPSCGFDDPCLIRRFAWLTAAGDGAESWFSVGATACAPRLSYEEVQRLDALLRDLVAPSGGD